MYHNYVIIKNSLISYLVDKNLLIMLPTNINGIVIKTKLDELLLKQLLRVHVQLDIIPILRLKRIVRSRSFLQLWILVLTCPIPMQQSVAALLVLDILPYLCPGLKKLEKHNILP